MDHVYYQIVVEYTVVNKVGMMDQVSIIQPRVDSGTENDLEQTRRELLSTTYLHPQWPNHSPTLPLPQHHRPLHESHQPLKSNNNQFQDPQNEIPHSHLPLLLKM
jgi:hypothetical protein